MSKMQNAKYNELVQLAITTSRVNMELLASKIYELANNYFGHSAEEENFNTLNAIVKYSANSQNT